MAAQKKTTVRMQALARALERCSARDMSDFVDKVGWGWNQDSRYSIYRRVLEWSAENYTANVTESEPSP